MLGEDGFGVELHALDIEFSVAHAHDLAVVRPRRDLQTRWAIFGRNCQRVVAVHRKGFRQSSKHTLLGCMDHAGFTVHQSLRPHDLSTKRRANALVA